MGNGQAAPQQQWLDRRQPATTPTSGRSAWSSRSRGATGACTASHFRWGLRASPNSQCTVHDSKGTACPRPGYGGSIFNTSAGLQVLCARGARESGQECSRRRDCHFDDTPLFAPVKTPTKGRGGCSRLTVSPTATGGRSVPARTAAAAAARQRCRAGRRSGSLARAARLSNMRSHCQNADTLTRPGQTLHQTAAPHTHISLCAAPHTQIVVSARQQARGWSGDNESPDR